MLLPIAASGGFLVRTNWRALTPGLAEIRLFDLATWLDFVCYRVASGCETSGSAASWLFSSRQQAHFLLEHGTRAFLKPNVRAKRATTAGRQALGSENVHRTTAQGLAACRWRSA